MTAFTNPPLILERPQLERMLDGETLYDRIEGAFVAYSRGEAVVPPPGELFFANPPGETHIKYGAIAQNPFFVVKVASSFYENPSRGLSSSQGVVLALDSGTGELRAVLLDGGLLTDVRTAVAGALCAKALAPRRLERIGIVGTGIQARLQLRYLRSVTPCRLVSLWGRDAGRTEACRREMENEGFTVDIARDLASLCAESRLIVTTTPSHHPLISAADVRPGTHITAIGADTPDKQELETGVLRRAALVATDSREHCAARGEISHALRSGDLEAHRIVELGAILDGRVAGRESEEAITVADLTGLAVQDLAIAQFVIERNAATH